MWKKEKSQDDSKVFGLSCYQLRCDKASAGAVKVGKCMYKRSLLEMPV